MSSAVKLRLADQDFIVLPRTEYLRLVEAAGPSALKKAAEVIDDSIGSGLRKARETAELTQTELAQRLGVKQPVVSKAESGKGRVGEKYVARVLKACGLPPDWS